MGPIRIELPADTEARDIPDVLCEQFPIVGMGEKVPAVDCLVLNQAHIDKAAMLLKMYCDNVRINGEPV